MLTAMSTLGCALVARLRHLEYNDPLGEPFMFGQCLTVHTNSSTPFNFLRRFKKPETVQKNEEPSSTPPTFNLLSLKPPAAKKTIVGTITKTIRRKFGNVDEVDEIDYSEAGRAAIMNKLNLPKLTELLKRLGLSWYKPSADWIASREGIQNEHLLCEKLRQKLGVGALSSNYALFRSDLLVILRAIADTCSVPSRRVTESGLPTNEGQIYLAPNEFLISLGFSTGEPKQKAGLAFPGGKLTSATPARSVFYEMSTKEIERAQSVAARMLRAWLPLSLHLPFFQFIEDRMVGLSKGNVQPRLLEQILIQELQQKSPNDSCANIRENLLRDMYSLAGSATALELDAIASVLIGRTSEHLELCFRRVLHNYFKTLENESEDSLERAEARAAIFKSLTRFAMLLPSAQLTSTAADVVTLQQAFSNNWKTMSKSLYDLGLLPTEFKEPQNKHDAMQHIRAFRAELYAWLWRCGEHSPTDFLDNVGMKALIAAAMRPKGGAATGTEQNLEQKGVPVFSDVLRGGAFFDHFLIYLNDSVREFSTHWRSNSHIAFRDTTFFRHVAAYFVWAFPADKLVTVKDAVQKGEVPLDWSIDCYSPQES